MDASNSAGGGSSSPRGGTSAAYAAAIGAAFIFGTTFLVVKDAVAQVPPMSFLAVRFLIGAAVLAPFATRRPAAPGWWRAGVVCGTALAAGYILQTIGLQHTSGSVSAFITYLLVVMVPPLQAILLGVRTGRSVWLGALVCTAGLLMLTGGTSSFGGGEVLTLGCALAFALHVVALGALAPRHDPIRLNAVQLATVGFACLPGGFVTGGYHFTPSAMAAAVGCGVGASAVALGLQVFAQSRLSAARVSLLLLIEPVSAAGLGLFAGDHLGIVGAVGAGLILAGIVASEMGVLDGGRGAPTATATVLAVDR